MSLHPCPYLWIIELRINHMAKIHSINVEIPHCGNSLMEHIDFLTLRLSMCGAIVLKDSTWGVGFLWDYIDYYKRSHILF